MKRFRTIYFVLTIAVLGISFFMIYDALKVKSSTGLLHVTSSNSNATLAISKSDSSAAYLGINSATVRLKPGVYLVSGEINNQIVMKSVTVAKGYQTSVSLNINAKVEENQINNKLIAKLPETGPASEYSINYYLLFNNGQSTPVITVDSISASAQQQAINWLNYYGFNLKDYKIIYTIQPSASSNANYFVGG